MHNYTPRVFLIVGSPASGKDELIAAVNTIGKLHAEIVPKHTNRDVRIDDGDEMICRNKYSQTGELEYNDQFDLDNCDFLYENFGTAYGIKTSTIWDKLQNGVNQVVVVSNREALNQMMGCFGNLTVVVYVYSQITRDEYRERELTKLKNSKGNNVELSKEEAGYIERRVTEFDKAWNIYVENFMLFNHVLVYADAQEDLFDQVFRLFKAYEKGLLR